MVLSVFPSMAEIWNKMEKESMHLVSGAGCSSND